MCLKISTNVVQGSPDATTNVRMPLDLTSVRVMTATNSTATTNHALPVCVCYPYSSNYATPYSSIGKTISNSKGKRLM